jgi:hypothetical protein
VRCSKGATPRGRFGDHQTDGSSHLRRASEKPGRSGSKSYIRHFLRRLMVSATAYANKHSTPSQLLCPINAPLPSPKFKIQTLMRGVERERAPSRARPDDATFPRARDTPVWSRGRRSGSGRGRGGTPYKEFRTILTGVMMEAYRAEGNMLVLVITKLLLDRDTFETGEMAARVRSQGWAMRDGARAGAGTCAGCQRPLMP